MPIQPVPVNNQVSPLPVTPQPVSSGRSCAGTALIIILTVICTLLVEAILVFAAGAYLFKKVTTVAKNELSSYGLNLGDDNKNNLNNAASATELTKEQKDLLIQLGVKPEDVPPEAIGKISCAETALGAGRVKEIIDGKSTPSFTDLFKVKNCFTE